MSLPVTHTELKVLSTISRIIGDALNLDQALGDILGLLSDSLSMNRATVALLDEPSGQLFIRASHGLRPEEKSRGVYRLDEGVTGRVFKTGKPYFVKDIRHDPLFLDKTGTRRDLQTRLSFVAVPIILHGRAIGVLYVDRPHETQVSSGQDIAFLSIVATLIAQFVNLNEQFTSSMEALRIENVSLKSRLSREISGIYIVGKSQAMQEVQRQVEKVSPTRATVLLLGESGTGKTLISKFIHELSDRKSFPFTKVNCAAIPENLLESELFGYEKGAFTGALGPKPGRFEQADKGTIFLDEIGEIPLGIQAKLLRFLQEREFERLGSTRTRKVDVRILAATNQDLLMAVEERRFRKDLYYRLNVFPIKVPTLRKRTEDILPLLNHFLDKMAREYDRRLYFTPGALDALVGYDWPGNVREMENLVERLAIIAEQSKVDLEHLAPFLEAGTPAQPAAENPLSLEELERRQVLTALKRNDWVQTHAARELGVSLRQMGYRLKKYGLEAYVKRQRRDSRA